MQSHLRNNKHKQYNAQLKTMQNENQNIFLSATPGREKLMTLQKTIGILRKMQIINPRYIPGKVTKFHEV